MYRSFLNVIAMMFAISFFSCKTSNSADSVGKSELNEVHETYEMVKTSDVCKLDCPDNPINSAVYHWKSSVDLSDMENRFLKQNNVAKVYLRFFDIRTNFNYGPVPDAEVETYMSSFPKSTEIVPCVFITLESLKWMDGSEKEFAKKIYERIYAKCKNGGIKYREIQLDCDWTESTRETFFNLCKEVKRLAAANGRTVSSTIRLHQLSQPHPDVDRGVLMVYNVGDLKNSKETNSILRSDIVKKYLKKAPKYKIPLDVAYPVFSWGVVFNGKDFQRLTRINGNPDTIKELRRIRNNVYALRSNMNADVNINFQETVRYEMASFNELIKTKKLVENYLGYKPQNTILYHLGEEQLTKYTPAQIKKLYE